MITITTSVEMLLKELKESQPHDRESIMADLLAELGMIPNTRYSKRIWKKRGYMN